MKQSADGTVWGVYMCLCLPVLWVHVCVKRSVLAKLSLLSCK